MSFDSDEFILVEWSLNRIFTVIQNYKNVKLNDTVTCRVNDIKDTGIVVYVGTEEKCNQILINFDLERSKLKKIKKSLSRDTKLNLPDNDFLRRSSLSSLSTIGDNSSKFGQKYASAIFNYLSNKNDHNNHSCSKLDDIGKPKSLSLDESMLQSCPNCTKLKKEINELNKKILKLEKLKNISPLVIKWFEEFQDLTKMNPIDSVDLSNLSLNHSNNKTNSIPEIKIDDLWKKLICVIQKYTI
ncbi:hypothetical protein BpHYR1_014404 [Brachionus plicatilis]|uniref:Uncharacterized protein n=1 Tax=Brachionus plicatilis TaxID=10195 RepID=A0A3M7QBZ5_BRAPC|nr:hypothetical protein BpHYR1_014404 [Brachionus plicatilis]